METQGKIGRRVKRRPIIQKTGAICSAMEQTPIVFGGKLILIESASENGQVFLRAHDYRNGRIYPGFAHGHYFASAYVENGVVYAFCTSARDNGALTMYQSDDPSTWHDPRGGQSVMMFWSRDLITWEGKEVLHIPKWRLWNTSVCKGADGYVMAIEVSPNGEGHDPEVGSPFTCFFAKSPDLLEWTMMDTGCCYTRERYNACPALRFFEGWYYMICLEALPCTRYAPYIYRSRDLREWAVSDHNPIMMFGDEDRVAHPLSNLTEAELELLECGLNINNSDVDLCEFEGKTYIYYANGDQMLYSFLEEAVYDGPIDEFLRGFF